jgi:hypothetical protein
MSKYPGNIITTGADAGYSVFFDGTGDYLSIADNAAFQFAGDFTIEFWIYANNLSATQRVLVKGNSAASDYSIDLNTAGTFSFNNNTVINTSTASIRANTWNHVAVTRSGLSTNNCTWWINGVASNTFTTAQNYNNTSALWFGQNQSTGLNLNGYLSNIRIVKGTALYTAAFTPPTQLFRVTNTSLLTCNSPAIVDQSTNAFAITANGNAAVSTFTPFTGYQTYNPALGAATPGIWTVSDAQQAAQTRLWNMYDPYFTSTSSKISGNPGTNVPTWITDASSNNFTVTSVADARAARLSPFSVTTYPYSGSGYFDGTGDYLTLGGQSAFAFGTGDFTIEGWFYVTTTAAAQILIDFRPASTDGLYPMIFVASGGGSIRYNVSNADQITGTTTISTNTWYHVAVVRISGSTKMYVNGTQVGSTYTDSNNYLVGASRPVIGAGASTIGATPLTGYMSNVRLVKGVGVYTGAFTTPTAPLTSTQSAGTNIAAITGTSTSLLTLQNWQSSNNSAFLDSSTNNFLVSRTDNPTQGSFNPFSPAIYSGYFVNSTTNFVTNSATNLCVIGTNQFCYEAWVYPTAYPAGGGTIFANFNTSTGANGVNFWVSSTGVPGAGENSGVTLVTGGSAPLNTWTHIAVVRTTTAINLYVNGILVNTNTNSTYVTKNYTSGKVFIGGIYPVDTLQNGYSFTGYINNLRVTIGEPVYTSNFTPSRFPLPALSNTKLLSCQNGVFRDNSSQNIALYSGGGVATIPFSPIYANTAYDSLVYGGSAYFDGGATDRLTFPANSAFALGTGAWTMEAWVYPITLGTSNRGIMGVSGSGGNTDISIYASNLSGVVLSTTSAQIFNTANSSLYFLRTNIWTHIAVTRNASNTVTLWINGYQITTATMTQDTTSNVGYVGGGNWDGYIASARFVKGLQVYTGTFVPPALPLEATQSSGTNIAAITTQTSGLLKFANAGIVDATTYNNWVTVADARINTAASKFGGSAMYFDGTGDYIFPSTSNLGAFGTGDFTIEFWINFNTVSANQVIMDFRSATSTVAPAISLTSAGVIYYYTGGASPGTRITGSTLVVNTWYHIAVCRASAVTRLFVNGTQVGSNYADTNNYVGVLGRPWIGGLADGTTPAQWVNAYVQDVRITKGFARYPSNFTAPTSLLQNQ